MPSWSDENSAQVTKFKELIACTQCVQSRCAGCRAIAPSLILSHDKAFLSNRVSSVFPCSLAQCAQGAGSAPSAPPYPANSTGGNVHYPDIYQGGGGGGRPPASAEEQRNKDFWNENLGEKDKEKGTNQGFWGAALGGNTGPSKPPPAKNEAAEEFAR